MKERYDLIVIGSGPGGYVAAIRAARLGLKTALMESREIGGTCLNRGCIPTKTLLHSSRLYQEARHFEEAGINCNGLSFDYGKIMERKDAVVDKIRKGINGLLSANGVTVLYGKAAIPGEMAAATAAHRIVLTLPDGGTIPYGADRILIATGAKPVLPRIEGVGLPEVITSDELLSRDGKLYRRLLIIGGGVIGIEFATIYRDLGCEVEILEAMDRILPNTDKEISQSVAMSLKKKGIQIHTKVKVIRIRQGDNGELFCDYEEGKRSNTDADLPDMTGIRKTAAAEGVLLSVGRRANTEGLFGENFAPEMEGACIRVDENFETSIPGIYAIGDAIKGKQLAHEASAQGIAAVERMCGREPSVNLEVIPSCIYTSPEVAAVGMGEAEAAEQGYTVKTGKYPMLGNSKTILSQGERGFIKVICDAESDRLLGAVLLCDRATDMVSEFASAIACRLTVKELAAVIRPHPTYSEAITEALEDVENMAIHLMPSKR